MIRPLVAALCLAVPASAAAQQRSNLDQSGYTQLRAEGYPIRSGLPIVEPGEAKLADADLVIGVAIGEEARAYPVNLMWGPENEALNDVIAGVPVAATWCPIAHSGVVYERTLRGSVLDLGALGLERGVFRLYDRQTRSRWSQVSGVASQGALSGRTLRKRESTLTTWGTWRRLHPGTTVFFDRALGDHHPFNEEAIARITFSADGDRLRDTETGSSWDALTGLATSGPLAGRRLQPQVVTTALWYAWRSQHPGTTLWGAEPGRPETR